MFDFEHQFHVTITEYRSDGVWVATSEDIVGLTIEEDSFEACLTTLFDVGAELLAHNHGLNQEQIAHETLLHTHIVHHLHGAPANVRSIPVFMHSDAAVA